MEEETDSDVEENFSNEEKTKNSESKYFSSSSKSRTRSSNRKSKRQSVKPVVKISTISNSDDSDFEVVGKSKSKRSKKKNEEIKPVKILSESSNEADENGIKQKVDIWSEVFLKKEKKWICVDFLNKDIDCTAMMEQRCSNTLVYVIGFNPGVY